METTDAGLRSVVCDAGPVIHLDELGCLDLLSDFAQVLVPDTVRGEIERHRPAALHRPGLSWPHIAPLRPVSPELLALSRILPLHDGEVEALRVAADHPGALLLTDDTAARMAASSLRIPVHGTIGILLRSIRRKQRSRQAVADILRELPQRSSLYIRPALLTDFIRAVEQSQNQANSRWQAHTTAEREYSMPDQDHVTEIRKRIQSRGISRLVHFTRVSSLQGIVRDGRILCIQELPREIRGSVRNDPKRLDDQLDYICCSVEYPNIRLLDRFREKQPDQHWVLLSLKPDILAVRTTKFSPVNAASQRGGLVGDGIDGFESMFSSPVREWIHGGWRTVIRRKQHLPNLPTHPQAEVLVKGQIPISNVIEVVIDSDTAFHRVHHLVDDWPVDKPPITVQPLLFNKNYLDDLWRD